MFLVLTFKTFPVVFIATHISSEIISGKFPVANVSQIDYGIPLDWFYISGFKRCFMECQKQVLCQSIVYSKETNVCKTNKVAVPPTSLMTSSDPSVPYYYYTGKVSKVRFY